MAVANRYTIKTQASATHQLFGTEPTQSTSFSRPRVSTRPPATQTLMHTKLKLRKSRRTCNTQWQVPVTGWHPLASTSSSLCLSFVQSTMQNSLPEVAAVTCAVSVKLALHIVTKVQGLEEGEMQSRVPSCQPESGHTACHCELVNDSRVVPRKQSWRV